MFGAKPRQLVHVERLVPLRVGTSQVKRRRRKSERTFQIRCQMRRSLPPGPRSLSERNVRKGKKEQVGALFLYRDLERLLLLLSV